MFFVFSTFPNEDMVLCNKEMQKIATGGKLETLQPIE
jgi:hypothetical protein